MPKLCSVDTYDIKHNKESHYLDLEEISYIGPIFSKQNQVDDVSMLLHSFNIIISKNVLMFNFFDLTDAKISYNQLLEKWKKYKFGIEKPEN